MITLIISRKCGRAGLDELYGELGEGSVACGARRGSVVAERRVGAWWRKEGLEGGGGEEEWCEVIIITSTEALAE